MRERERLKTEENFENKINSKKVCLFFVPNSDKKRNKTFECEL